MHELERKYFKIFKDNLMGRKNIYEEHRNLEAKNLCKLLQNFISLKIIYDKSY